MRETPFRPFRPAPWVRGPHLQTIWAQLSRSRRLVVMSREPVTTPDGDEVLLDHAVGPPGSPRLLILHGLEGSSFSPYAQGLAAYAQRRGLRATVLNFRSCARRFDDRTTWIPNKRPRLYHSGETTDLDHVLGVLRRREPDVPIVAIGVSLGGNVLLKWLGEHPRQDAVVAAATLSVPYDLAAGSAHLARGVRRVYVFRFLRSLIAKARHLAACFPEVREKIDLTAVEAARDFVAFDDAATAPLHGFAGAAEYYAASSALGWIDRIETPTFCLSAADDPFLPSPVLERVRDRASAAVTTELLEVGGHVGFVDRRTDRRDISWGEERAFTWLADHLASRARSTSSTHASSVRA